MLTGCGRICSSNEVMVIRVKRRDYDSLLIFETTTFSVRINEQEKNISDFAIGNLSNL